MARAPHLLLLIAALAPGRAYAQDEAAEPVPPTEATETIEATGATEEEPTEAEAAPGEAEPAEAPEASAPDEADHVRGATQGEDVVRTFGDAINELGEVLAESDAPTHRIHWNPSWPRYRFDELAITVGAGLTILFEELLPTRTDANWQAVTDFDLEVARALSLGSWQERDAVEELSNGIVAGLIAWPVLFDALIYAGLGENSWDVAWQLSLIGLEVFSLNHVLNVLVRVLARRERPLGQFCREDPTYDDPICADQPPAESFWSPQVSNAFAGAALVCMYHDALDLFGETWSDGLACGTAVAAAATTGLLRIMSDQHWVTDVLSGAVVGTAIGMIVPWVLHFQGGARPPLGGNDPPTITVLPMMGTDTLGVSVMGLL
ncbi:MAG: phosphatase PAP2 family protein [Sandaracinaceae bacterium]|nr:phosphatase PAP2 family protein [Sandaracinaceae bacterium]